MLFVGTHDTVARCLSKGGQQRSYLQCQTINNSHKTTRVARNRVKKIRPTVAKIWNVRSAILSAIANAKIRPRARNNLVG